MQRSLDDVVETLKKARERERKCALLIGAGCSVKAGIPLAGEFVEIIEKQFSRAYRRAEKNGDVSYPHCMHEIAPGDRHDLIAKYVDEAKINWAHVGIAQLMKFGYVDRILTTNFDPLIVRACALVGIFPAVYDFAASQSFDPARIKGQAIFYLHGQRSGFKILNTPEECDILSTHLAPVFQDAGSGRSWIVVGYSGENDPVFDQLADVECFDHNLYWVGNKDNEPALHLRERLLISGKYAHYVNGFDADDFFVTLAQKLGCFPPDFVGEPFTHLDNLLEMVTPYTLPGQDAETDVTKDARDLIQRAIERYESVPEVIEPEVALDAVSTTAMKLQSVLMAGKYDEIIAQVAGREGELPPEFVYSVTWAYVYQGDALSDHALTKSGQEADQLFELAGQKYQAALDIKPDMDEALYNWGNALSDHALTKSGEEADQLFKLSRQKYRTAFDIKPGDFDTLYNWGFVLSDHARTKSGEEADQLFELAGQKYQAALVIKPDDHVVLDNWGMALNEQAKTKTGKEADRLYKEAREKCTRANEISPGSGSYNLACRSALIGEEEECRKWLEDAYQHGELESREHLENDSDMDSVREREWFKEFLAKLDG